MDHLKKCARECRELQRKAARKLRSLASEMRKQQSDINTAKLACNTASAVGGTSVLIGAALAPFTGGLSLAIAASGAIVGGAGGVGGAVTSIVEIAIIKDKMDDAQRILDNLGRKATDLKTDIKKMLKKFNVSYSDLEAILYGSMYACKGGVAVYNILSEVKIIMDVVKGTVTAAEGAALSAGQRMLVGVGIVFSIAGMIQNDKDIKNDTSATADAIEKLARDLE